MGERQGMGKDCMPQRQTLRVVPRREKELEAAPRPKSQTGDCVGPRDSWLRQIWREGLGSQSEVLDLPSGCASWPRRKLSPAVGHTVIPAVTERWIPVAKLWIWF